MSVDVFKDSNAFPSRAFPQGSRCSDLLQTGVTGPRIPASQNIFSYLNVSSSIPRPTYPSILLELGFLPRVKTTRREFDHSSPSSIDVKNEWSCTSTTSIFLYNEEMENFYSLDLGLFVEKSKMP
jgi:hypothetical protein